jgi:hypothetical protein
VNRPATPYGYALFCDDIRREVGNKASLLGIYSGIAIFEADFPITIPRLCIAVYWLQDRDDERRPTKIKVFSSDEGKDELVIEGDIPIEAFDQAPMVTPDANILHAVIHIALAPFVVEKPSTLKVRAFYGDEEYKLGRLRMVKAPIDPPGPPAG